MLITTKQQEALRILHSCLSKGNGIFASPDRYLYQCWTRDVALAVAPLLHARGESAIVRTHLENLTMGQRPTGQIPILFVSDEDAWRHKKVQERGSGSFMVRRYDAGELWNLTPGTKDSEILYIIAMHEYANATGDSAFLEQNRDALNRALRYVEAHNMNHDGLAVGADWRDTMEVFLADRALLSNNALLTHAYDLLGEAQKARAHRERVMKHFWRDGACVDYIPDGDRPDPLGIALAVLFDVLPADSGPRVRALLRLVDTDYGVTIKCIHSPYAEGEVEVFERTQGVVVWPFVVGFCVMALKKLGYEKDAQAQFGKMERLEGFFEWYDPADGKGWGAREQLWSAALYLRASMCLAQ